MDKKKVNLIIMIATVLLLILLHNLSLIGGILILGVYIGTEKIVMQEKKEGKESNG